jgi:hypothetical protein
MWRSAAAMLPPGGAFYFAKNWVDNCPPCPPATYAPESVLKLYELFFEFKNVVEILHTYHSRALKSRSS